MTELRQEIVWNQVGGGTGVHLLLPIQFLIGDLEVLAKRCVAVLLKQGLKQPDITMFESKGLIEGLQRLVVVAAQALAFIDPFAQSRYLRCGIALALFAQFHPLA